ncbi:hypothetical protein GPOL_c09160 [Gordonia polyisoprenivorans VH2]|uniref:Fibronectin type-III domain-containing protein n=1 Tax=Gordonia polyisoprenivorans (strain DSM 44266 / VH2) TaxID=1112204 RepID=H6MZJ2_GORPV|nr:hypothetical protein [Gordonia polyisoprenivorans]AFA71979.1 hypothetical protein GPOL_c09160 [Gordonia polyisoprenivorans VH2]
MEPFVGNDYRKRVLAAVERRGGVEESDPFELYDIPIAEAATLSDPEVAARIDEVWAFWQKQRDHPKYRMLVEHLVAEHGDRSAPLRESVRRVTLARSVQARRTELDEQRYQLLDSAIERLVARYGGIPEGKRAGLDEIGAMGGLSTDEVATRLRRHRVVSDTPSGATASTPAAPQTLSAHKLSQITELLTEFSRRRSGPPAHTLLAVLDLTTDNAADRGEIRLRVDGMRHRARELPAGRMRAIVDELLIDIEEILLGPVEVTDAYLASVNDRVTEHLRPRIRAAILVEDRLHPDDHQFMLDEARELGLGTRDARRLIATIAAEYGGAVEEPSPPPAATSPTSTPPAPPAAAPAAGDWQRELRSARQALRKGRPEEARRRCAQARAAAGDDPTALRQIDAVADEAQRTLDATAPPPEPAPAPGPPPAAAASAEPPPAAPSQVRAEAVDGTVRVSWEPSPSAGVSYRVTRVEPNGRRQVVGRTSETALDDGGVGTATPLPTYEVTATRAGVHSDVAISGNPPPPPRPPAPAPTTPTAPTTPPTDDLPAVTDVRVDGDRVIFAWPDGVTEALVVIRADAPPQSPTDPAAWAKKITNTRYAIDGGFAIPGSIARPGHIAVAACRRDGSGALTVAAAFGPRARAALPATNTNPRP